MEKLTVKNFLNIKDIEFNLSKINIIIGQQASGKSVIAKLVYFGRNFFIQYRLSMQFHGQRKAEFDRSIIANFKTIFPEYAWKDKEFDILYENDQYYVRLDHKIISHGKQHKLSLEYSEHLVKIRRIILAEYKNKISEYTEIGKPYTELITEYEKNIFPRYIQQDIGLLTFIPAGRSFFADLQKNVFSFLSGKITIDYFLKEFGSVYEMAKNTYPSRKMFHEEYIDIIDDLVNQIIVGNYVFEKDQDWIYTNDNRKINLSNSSSGQQEALPMAIILAILPFISPTHLFIIEEPEAHLFPTSQKYIVNLISLVFNVTQKKHSFFITTHSPYILTAFNNLIQAGNTLKALQERPESLHLLEDLFEIIPDNQMLNINDIGAYTIKNGMMESIINQENNLIDTNIIDDVSNEFSRVFEKLLELELGE
ncbi:AAA family ATPase [Anabaena azotica]|uniref:AAA family ATPase n=1 Tax=Anabaena azotica TaxID=197653 RepID=UPI0039A58AF5